MGLQNGSFPTWRAENGELHGMGILIMECTFGAQLGRETDAVFLLNGGNMKPGQLQSKVLSMDMMGGGM